MSELDPKEKNAVVLGCYDCGEVDVLSPDEVKDKAVKGQLCSRCGEEMQPGSRPQTTSDVVEVSLRLSEN